MLMGILFILQLLHEFLLAENEIKASTKLANTLTALTCHISYCAYTY